MESIQASEKQVRPEFGRLIDRITIESNGAVELTSRIRDLTSILMPFEESAPIKEDAIPIMPGVIGELWMELEKIRRANLNLEEIMHHLERIVGNPPQFLKP